jgi:hypothetical protein
MLKLILLVHIAGGSVALLSMFIPMVARKGGMTHRRAGWVFVGGMTTVSITALVLAGARFLTDPRPDAQKAGLFLFYVAILTGAGVSAGVRVLGAKRRTGRHTGAWDIGVAVTLVATSVMVMVYGITVGMPLFIAFPTIGLFSGGGQLRYWLRAQAHPMHWWFEHMSSMLGSCIAAVTAFLVANAGNLGLPRTSLLVWLGPSLIGAPAIAIWIGYYRRKFAHLAPRRIGQEGHEAHEGMGLKPAPTNTGA